MKIRTVLVVVLLFGSMASALAQPIYPGQFGRYANPVQTPEPTPAQILKQGLRKLVAFVGAEPGPDRMQAVAFLEREIVPYFDFGYMARWAAGARIWERMGEVQRNRLESEIKQDFLATLATRLTGYGEQSVKVLRPRRAGNNEVVVGAVILNPGAYPAKLNFRFYRSTDGWKIFDVAANGSSAVMYYRQQFRRAAQPQGYRR